MDLPLAEVGRPVGLQELFGHALELTLAAGGQIAPLRAGGGVLIEERGQLQLLPDALGHAAGEFDALLHAHVLLRNEGDDVDGAHARVLPLVLSHVDGLDGLLGEPEGDLLDGLRRADHREHAAVVAAVGLHVEQGAAGHGIGHVHQTLEHGLVALLADGEIGDAFYELCHKKDPPVWYFLTEIIILPAAGVFNEELEVRS